MSGGDKRQDRFIAIADAQAGDGRDLLTGIAQVFCAGRDRFSESQLNHYESILLDAITEADATRRSEIATILAEAPAAPQRLICLLALDEFAVAAPVLRLSPVLDEETLLRIARRGSAEHRRAIASRRPTLNSVAAELVERGDEATLRELVENDSVTMDTAAMMRLVARARTLPALHAPLVNRADLTPESLTHIYFYVPSALKRQILLRAESIESSIVAQAIHDNRRSLAKATENGALSAPAALRRQMAEASISERVLNDLIESERFDEFTLALSYFVGVDAAAGAEIVNDHSWQPLLIACRATNLERSTFARITSTLIQSGDEHNEAVRMLDLYQRIPTEAAERLTRFWRVCGTAVLGPERRRFTPTEPPRHKPFTLIVA